MSPMTVEDGQRFVKEYYNTLCKSVQSIVHYYTPDTSLSVSKEGERPEIYKGEFDKVFSVKHGKEIFRVLISSMDCHTQLDGTLLICAIGQFVYEDSSSSRFTASFLVEKSDRFIIRSEVCRFLDEEIIYEKGEEERREQKASKFRHGWKEGERVNSHVTKSWKSFTIKDGCDKFSNQQLIRDFSRYGDISGIERREDKSIAIEYFMGESLDKLRDDLDYLRNKGYNVEVRKKPFKGGDKKRS
jgi:hypothetical protein